LDELDTEIDWLRLDEDVTVIGWRTQRLLALGYELGEAGSLALSDLDIHELEQLIENGCPRETAVRIAV
jgi:hypothetical protein